MRRWVRGRLWQHPDFRRFWFSQTIDLFGGQVVDLALPTIAILPLHASPAQVGLLVGLEYVGFPILGLIAGVWADRVPRRPIMIAANVGPLLAYTSVPVAFILHLLTLGQLYLVALVTSCFNVFYEVAYQSYLPSLVDRVDLVEANQKLEVSHSASHTVGPGLSGLIIQLVGPAWAVGSTVVTLLTSTAALLLIRKPETIARTRAAGSALRVFWGELRDGIRSVLDSHVIRGLTACDATASFAINMTQAVWLLFAYRQLHLSPAQVGLVLTLGALGFVPGALSATVLARRLGLGRALLLAAIVGGVGILVIPVAALAAPIVVLAVGWLLIYSPSPVFEINAVSLRQAITPEHLQGRMNATVHTVIWAAAPLGALVGGLLATAIGVPETILLSGVIAILSIVWLLAGPVRALRSHAQVALQA